jgi:hypothetical protein
MESWKKGAEERMESWKKGAAKEAVEATINRSDRAESSGSTALEEGVWRKEGCGRRNTPMEKGRDRKAGEDDDLVRIEITNRKEQLQQQRTYLTCNRQDVNERHRQQSTRTSPTPLLAERKILKLCGAAASP